MNKRKMCSHLSHRENSKCKGPEVGGVLKSSREASIARGVSEDGDEVRVVEGAWGRGGCVSMCVEVAQCLVGI